MNADVVYNNLMDKVLKEGERKEDRTGTGTVSIFGAQAVFDLKEGFPLLQGKKVSARIIFEELRWFLSKTPNLKGLLDNKVNIWTDDAYRFYQEKGGTLSKEEFVERAKTDGFDMGPIYPKQWRDWDVFETEEDGTIVQKESIDQIANVIENIKNNPYSRRHVVTSWNPAVLHKISLPACHTLFQFGVSSRGLSCELYMRSNDGFLGAPYNIASYAMLTHMIAKMTGLEVDKLVISYGDLHIYTNHIEQVKEQLSREIKPMPTLTVKTVKEDISDYTFDDLLIEGYDPHPPIKGKLSVG